MLWKSGRALSVCATVTSRTCLPVDCARPRRSWRRLLPPSSPTGSRDSRWWPEVRHRRSVNGRRARTSCTVEAGQCGPEVGGSDGATRRSRRPSAATMMPSRSSRRPPVTASTRSPDTSERTRAWRAGCRPGGMGARLAEPSHAARSGASGTRSLHRLIVNACADQGRHRSRRSAEVRMLRIDPSTDDTAHSIDDHDQLDRGFRRLKPDQRAAVALHFCLGLTVPEVADALGFRWAPPSPGSTTRSRSCAPPSRRTSDQRSP